MSPKAVWISLVSIILLVPQPSAAQSQFQPERLDVTNWPAGVGKKSDLPPSRASEYEFDGVEIRKIEEWISWIGVEIPFDVSGSLSGWLWAQRSRDGWLNFAGYRIEGQVFCPRLRVEQWEFRAAELRFGYMDDRWYVSRLAGEVASAGNDTPIGQAEFSATMPQTAPRMLQIFGQVDQAQLKPLLEAFDISIDVANETGTLDIAASVPLDRASEPAAWLGNAAVDVRGIRSQNIPRSALTAKFDLANGQWRMTDAQLNLIDQTIDLDGNGKLESQLPFNATFAGRRLSIPQLLQAGKQPQLASRLIGTLDAVGSVRGELTRGIESASLALRSAGIQYDGAELQDLLVDAVLDNRESGKESLALDLKSASIAGGKIAGTMRWSSLQSALGLVPDAANLRCTELNLARLPGTLIPVSLAGVANGRIEFTSKLAGENQLRAWSTAGLLAVDRLAISGAVIGQTEVSFSKSLDSDRLQTQFAASNNTLHVLAELVFDENEPVSRSIKSYVASGSVNNFQTQFPLAGEARRVPVALSGSFNVQGTPTSWLSGGKAELLQVVVQLADQSVELNDLVLNIREDAFRLERFTVRDSRGRIAGSALVRRNGIGEHLLNLRVADVEIGPYVTQLAPGELSGLAGTIDFESRLKKAAASSHLRAGWSGTFAGEIDAIEYRTTPIGQVGIRGTVNGDRVRAHAEGSVLGGEWQLDGTLGLANSESESSLGEIAEFKSALSGVQLDRLMSLVLGPRLGQQYTGAADLTVESDDALLANALRINLAVPNFAFQRQQLANDLNADMQLADGRLSLNELTGGFAHGRINVRGDLQWTDGRPSGDLQFAVNRAQLNGLASLVLPEDAKNYSGVVTYRGRATLADEIVLSGSSQFRDLVVYRLPIQEVRNELTIRLSNTGELVTAEARNAQGTALGGRFDGEVILRGGPRYSLKARGKIGNGKLEQLSRGLGFEHIVGTGSFTATARLNAADVTDLRQFSGPLQVDFENGDAQSVPLLSDVGRLIPVVQMASTNIKSGTMHGQLGQGQLRINDLLLISDAFWLVADGSASLTTNRLDLNALLQTGGGVNDQLLQAGSQELLAVVLPQLALLSEINNFVSNRTVYFHIGGSAQHPVIQPQAAQTAARAFLQNFKRKLLLPSAAASASASN